MTFTHTDIMEVANFYNPVHRDIEKAYEYGFCAGQKYMDNFLRMMENENIVFYSFSRRTRNKIQKEVNTILSFEGMTDRRKVRSYDKHLMKLYKITKKAFEKVVM